MVVTNLRNPYSLPVVGFFMERTSAENLVDALMRHPHIIQPHRDFFVQVLLQTPEPASSEFSVPVARHTPQRYDGREEFGYLSLRYVLHNRTVARPSLIEHVVEAFSRPPFLPAHSSPALLSDIRNNWVIRELMTSSPHPYSLLGMFNVFDCHDDERAESMWYPFLVIPGAEGSALASLVQWEEMRTRHAPVRA